MNLRRESNDSIVLLAKRLIASQFPQWSHLPISPVDRQGNDNRTLRLGTEMSIRLPSAERYVAAVDKEYMWLPHLSPRLPLEIPVPVARGEPGEGYLWRWSINRWLDGETAKLERIDDPIAFAVSLAEFLRALYRIDTTDGPPAGVHSFFRGASLSVYDDQTRQALAALHGVIDTDAALRVWETALATEWNKKPVWFHGDVAITNLLVRDGRLAAVIDFGTSGVGDPACDLAIAWTFFDRKTRDAFRSRLNLDSDTWTRGRGWALWKALTLMAQRHAVSPNDPKKTIWTHNPMTGRPRRRGNDLRIGLSNSEPRDTVAPPKTHAHRQASMHIIRETNFPNLGELKHGKVRDIYTQRDKLILIPTDRHSSFDRIIAHIPNKGAVLNLSSAFWFRKTEDIVKNHVLDIPDPNVTVAKRVKPLAIEAVMRGYLTGTTSTSIWTRYQNGERQFGDLTLANGLKKNTKLPHPIFDPTTKEDTHDRALSLSDLVVEGFITQPLLDKVKATALALFARGQDIAAQHGLILVDTKYEFGLDQNGELILIDEIHTPDSSRYWKLGSHEERTARGEEPEYFDKEFLRLWFKEHSDPYKDAVLPEAPADMVTELSRRYIEIYEQLTGEKFSVDQSEDPLSRMEKNLRKYRI